MCCRSRDSSFSTEAKKMYVFVLTSTAAGNKNAIVLYIQYKVPFVFLHLEDGDAKIRFWLSNCSVSLFFSQPHSCQSWSYYTQKHKALTFFTQTFAVPLPLYIKWNTTLCAEWNKWTFFSPNLVISQLKVLKTNNMWLVCSNYSSHQIIHWLKANDCFESDGLWHSTG